jgi:hypothetical protein
MPEEKMGIKQTAATMEKLAAKADAPAPDTEGSSSTSAKIENMGRETIDGIECNKYAFTTEGQTAYSWNDVATGRPVRMKSEQGTIDWKNYKAGPQKKELFEAPKDYEIQDMDAIMEQMSASGMGSMAGAMMGGMGGQMGSGLGAGFGSALGAGLGGPLGAMAGQYLGGVVGGMVGKKTASAVTGK